ncbi:MAG: hypothetical protein WED11_11840 [Natronospirillum sp.]
MTSEKEPLQSEWTVFMDGLTSHDYPQPESDRLAGLWPDAESAATEAIRHLPPMGWFSFRKPFMAFVTLCRVLDQLQTQRDLSDEQVQLALTILRMRSEPYQKAEKVFSARTHRLTKADHAALPNSAREFLLAVSRLPNQ